MLKTVIFLVICATSVVLSMTLPPDDCDKPCHYILAQVCASDGHTYPNACVLDIAMCKNKRIKLVHKGRCRKDEEVCDVSTPCPDISAKVCGTDGKTYSNPCYLRKAICDNPDLRQAHEGIC